MNKKIITISFLICIYTVFIGIGVLYLVDKIDSKGSMENVEKSIDWSKEYAFDDDKIKPSQNKQENYIDGFRNK